MATDVVFLILPPVNNDLFIYIFATGLGYEIKYVSNSELNSVAYISAKVNALSTSVTNKPRCSE